MQPLACVLSLGLACFAGPESAAGLGLGDVAKSPATVAAAQGPSYRPEPSQVLLLVQAFYDGTSDMQARFEQTYYNPTYGTKPTTTRGDLKLKKPGRMVWDYKDKADADFYANGKNLWVVEHDTRQVVTKSVDKNSDVSAAMKFLFGGQQLTREFKVRYAQKQRAEKYGDDKHHVLELKPKKRNPHYKGLALVVHATTGRVDAFVVYNTDGSSNYFKLSGIRTNKGIGDGVFEFDVPRGYVESKE